MKKLLIYEIKQLTRETEEKSDIYQGDNKLIELWNSTYGDTRTGHSTFLLSAQSSGFWVNLYVLEVLVRTSMSMNFKCDKHYWIRHQSLKVFKFPNAPTCLVELGDDKFACGIGSQLKVIDIKTAKDTGIIFDGHLDWVRSISKISKTFKIKRKVKGVMKTVKQRHHWLISTGSDW